MEFQPEFSENKRATANPAPGTDPRLQPTPDYGTLGPGSDIANAGRANTGSPKAGSANKNQLAMLVALSTGIFLALVAGIIGNARAAWSRADRTRVSSHASSVNAANIDQLQPQQQAEKLLALAVGNSANAVDQISSRVDRWHGQLVWDSQMASLTTAALNSNELRVRESGIEVELAAYGLNKNSKSLDYLLGTVDSPNHAQKIWALWALGLMGNRGVEPDRVVQVLSLHLQDSDVDSRRWSVDGLALTGSDSAIPLLLGAMHNDSSPIVRQEAACAIAQSGIFTPEQRINAVPQLLNYTDDPSLDAQTHAWAFQALNDITGQHLPNDSEAWRTWYQNRN